MQLHGKVALVTGGAHRLGRAIALALAGAGANVIIHYNSSPTPAEATLAELRALGTEAHALSADLGDLSALEQMVDRAIAHWGQLDVLVNNAGIWGATPIGTVTAERWAELFDINVRSAFFATQRAAAALRATQGCVVNIADVGIFSPWRNHTPYLTSKGAVASMTEVLAKDLAPEVRVNAIAPGPVLLPEDWTEEQREQSRKGVLLQRLGTPEDIGQAALYFATASYVTGVVMPVDGGQRWGPR